MKNYIAILSFFPILLLAFSSKAQTINWNGAQAEPRHVVSVNIGLEHGTVYGFSYGYRIHHRLFPTIVNVAYSFPSGEELFDDFKIKVGGQIRWFEFQNMQFSTNLHGVIRRYENDYSRLLNFGSDFSGVLGYYRSGWFVAGEFGFDKAIITHIRHSEIYSDDHPGVSNGWYGPTTGGNFYYGMQAGFSMRKQDVFVRAGKFIGQDWKTSPTIPYYGQLGYTISF